MALGTTSILTGFETANFENNPIQTSYDEGWEQGFCEGWKDVKGQYSVCPVTPLTPLPKLNCSEGYRCGYNRGFKYGMCKAEGYSNCKK